MCEHTYRIVRGGTHNKLCTQHSTTRSHRFALGARRLEALLSVNMTTPKRSNEEIVEEFYKVFDTDNIWQGEDEWTKNVPIGNLEQWLRTILTEKDAEVKKSRTTLHTSLVAAVEEIKEFMAVASSPEFEMGYQMAIKDYEERVLTIINSLFKE